jgi:hypothetical protein
VINVEKDSVRKHFEAENTMQEHMNAVKAELNEQIKHINEHIIEDGSERLEVTQSSVVLRVQRGSDTSRSVELRLAGDDYGGGYDEGGRNYVYLAHSAQDFWKISESTVLPFFSSMELKDLLDDPITPFKKKTSVFSAINTWLNTP